MLQKYLLLWLVATSSVAYAWPRAFPDSFDPFVSSKPLLPWMIAVTMFAIGLMLPNREVAQVLRRWPVVLGGTCIQYGCMPLLAFVVAHAFGLQGDYLIGVILVGCVPGAMASNVLTLNARGNTSYSVSLTTAATLLSPAAVPIAMMLALRSEKSVEMPFWATSWSLMLTVAIPVVSGHLIGRRLTGWSRPIKGVGTTIANLVILWIIAVVVGLNRQPLSLASGSLFGVLLIINIGGYTAGYLGGAAMRMPEPMRRALTLEVGMQNAGLGAVLATQLFDAREQIAIAPAMYTFGCMLTGTMLARYWSWRGCEKADNEGTGELADAADVGA